MSLSSTDWIAESDAERVANISVATLKRFIEAGYLSIESAKDGSRLFSKRQLEELFGFKTDLNLESPIRSTTMQSPATDLNASIERVVEIQQTEPVTAIPQAPNYNSEVSRLQKTIEMLDRIIEMKDQTIKDLKQQIDWFKGQIDRLEERSQRDQVLMLTENETIRNLAATMSRKSILRQIVDWIGLDSAPIKPAALQHRINHTQAEANPISTPQNDT